MWGLAYCKLGIGMLLMLFVTRHRVLDLTTVRCDKPPQPEGVEVTYDSLEYGSLIEYNCKENYTYSPVSGGSCNNYGLWTISPPDCQRKSFHIFITGLMLLKSLTIFVYGLTVAYLKTTVHFNYILCCYMF